MRTQRLISAATSSSFKTISLSVSRLSILSMESSFKDFKMRAKASGPPNTRCQSRVIKLCTAPYTGRIGEKSPFQMQLSSFRLLLPSV